MQFDLLSGRMTRKYCCCSTQLYGIDPRSEVLACSLQYARVGGQKKLFHFFSILKNLSSNHVILLETRSWVSTILGTPNYFMILKEWCRRLMPSSLGTAQLKPEMVRLIGWSCVLALLKIREIDRRLGIFCAIPFVFTHSRVFLIVKRFKVN